MKLNLVLLEVKINTLLDRFIKETRKRTQINKIKRKNEKQQRCQEIQRISKRLLQIYSKKMDNLEEMDKFQNGITFQD